MGYESKARIASLNGNYIEMITDPVWRSITFEVWIGTKIVGIYKELSGAIHAYNKI